MKRLLKRIVIIAAIVVLIGFLMDFGITAWVSHAKNYEAHSMHEGHLIVDEIKKHDSSVNATWDTADGLPNVVVRNVFDVEKQNAIIVWAKAVKQRGRIHRRVTLDFQAETPNTNGPDTVLRTVEF